MKKLAIAFLGQKIRQDQGKILPLRTEAPGQIDSSDDMLGNIFRKRIMKN